MSDNTNLEQFQIADGAVDDSKVADDAAILESKIQNLPATLDSKGNRSGAVMTGPLVLAHDPTQSLEAATKQYVDSLSGIDGSAQSLLIHTSGLKLTWLSPTKIRVSPGSILDSTNSGIIFLNQTISPDISVIGANGRDSSAGLVQDRFYYVHLIGDPSGVNSTAALFSLSSTAPSLPSGYTTFKPIGFVAINGPLFTNSRSGSTSSLYNQIKRFDSIGSGSFRTILWEDSMYISPGPSASVTNQWILDSSLRNYIPLGITKNPLMNASWYNGNLASLFIKVYLRKPGSTSSFGEVGYDATETARCNSSGGINGDFETNDSGDVEIMAQGYPANFGNFYIRGFNFEI